jgi:hypothetical protein
VHDTERFFHNNGIIFLAITGSKNLCNVCRCTSPSTPVKDEMKIRRAVKIAVKIVLGAFVFGIVGIIVLLALISRGKPDGVTLPKPSGPYPVGRVFFDWVD